MGVRLGPGPGFDGAGSFSMGRLSTGGSLDLEGVSGRLGRSGDLAGELLALLPSIMRLMSLTEEDCRRRWELLFVGEASFSLLLR